jgi:hypothetical protein
MPGANSDTAPITCDLTSFLGPELEEKVAAAYGFDSEQLGDVTQDLREAIAFQAMGSVGQDLGTQEDGGSDDGNGDEGDVLVSTSREAQVGALISYGTGAAVGRWDIRFATGERQPPPLPDPFDPLPVCPPGMLQGPDGAPAKPEDVPPSYPI